MAADDGKTGKDRNICPFIDDPDGDCYCVGMTSLKAFDAVRYCGGQYTLCTIYQRKMMQPRKRGDA